MKLGEVCDSISVTFDKTKQQVVLVNTSDVFNGKVTNHALVDNKGLKGQFKKTFQKGDILYSEIRPKNKRFAFIDFNANDYVASTKLMVIRANKKVLPQYLYQVLKSEEVINQLQSLAESRSGTFPQITFSELAQIDARIPELAEQKEIADFLKLFDDKIELNNKINHHLEEIGTAIWQEKFRNKVPNGTLGDIASISNGKRPPVKAAEPTYEEKIPILGASSVMGYTNQTLYHQKILVTGRVGTHGIIQRYQDSCWPSDNTLVLQSNYYEFVYQILKNIDFTAMNRGSTQPLITQTDLKKNKIYIPAANELANFEIIVGTHMKQYERNNIENDILSNLRNTLLPKLLSGELSITQATK